jgi:hypothetical protein
MGNILKVAGVVCKTTLVFFSQNLLTKAILRTCAFHHKSLDADLAGRRPQSAASVDVFTQEIPARNVNGPRQASPPRGP